MDPTLVTIDEDKRLILSQRRHELSWISTTEDFITVVEVVGRGVVRLYQLERWAELEGMTVDDASKAIRESRMEPMDPGAKLSALFLTTTHRKPQAGTIVLETKLPDLAVFALFEQGERPLTVIRGKAGGKGGKALMATFDAFAELWGQSVL